MTTPMTKDEVNARLKEIFSKPIASEQEYVAAWEEVANLENDIKTAGTGEYGLIHTLQINTTGTAYSLGGVNIRHPWWSKREQARRILGMHRVDMGSTLYDLACSMPGGHFPHPDETRSGQIAFYLNHQDLVRDKLTSMTVGRWLTKYFPVLPPEYVQRLEQAIRTDMDDSFYIAYDPDEVERVYVNSLAGVRACMSKSFEGHFRHMGHQQHPVRVYGAKQFGVGVAYLKDAEGRTTARSVIYDNPDDPADKRYVFVYGAPHLAKRLEKAGYKPGALRGAKLPLQRTDGGRVVMPWLDNKGDTKAETHATYAVWAAGDNFVRLMSVGDMRRWAGGEYQRDTYLAQSQSAYTSQREPVPLSVLYPTCSLSGVPLRGDAVHILRFVDGEGQIVRADKAAARDAGYKLMLRASAAVRTYTDVLVRVDDLHHDNWALPHRTKEQPAAGSALIYFAQGLDYTGFDKLDPGLYPELQTTEVEGVQVANVYSATCTLGDGRVVLDEDAVRVHINGGESSTFVHKSEVPALRKTHVMAYAHRGQEGRRLIPKDMCVKFGSAYYAKWSNRLHTTLAGRVVRLERSEWSRQYEFEVPAMGGRNPVGASIIAVDYCADLPERNDMCEWAQQWVQSVLPTIGTASWAGALDWVHGAFPDVVQAVGERYGEISDANRSSPMAVICALPAMRHDAAMRYLRYPRWRMQLYVEVLGALARVWARGENTNSATTEAAEAA